MGRHKNGKNKATKFALKDETRHGVLAVGFFVLGLFLILAGFGYAGWVGDKLHQLLKYVFGWGLFLFPLVSFLVGAALLKATRPKVLGLKTFGGLLFFVGGLGLLYIIFGNYASGVSGQIITEPLIALFDKFISAIFFSALAIIAILVIFDTNLSLERSLFGKRWGQDKIAPAPPLLITNGQFTNDGGEEETKSNEIINEVIVREKKDETDLPLTSLRPSLARPRAKFQPPPLTLLENDIGKPVAGDIKANSNIIKRTLANFGIAVEMDEVSIGPSITRYALKPAEGIKLSKILALQNDLALALAAHPIRIEAPIPGLALVGIEIPNRTRATVGLASLISSPAFINSPLPLIASLGRDISGIPHFTNLARAPHLLIAGSTGSGKSVVIHALITSLLYRNPPQTMRFIMIDPKRVELTLYNKIPHLLTPVVTNAQKAITVLKWAIQEMERRYEILEKEKTRDIQSYHKSNPQAPELMPYIVVIIDELADIMTAYPRELEATIVRLAQMSRAVGIHLVLSTQRPSVEILTGLIKANIPTRLALQVASQIDSRTILDIAGAEKLLGAGDMLYLSNERAKPLRLQASFISETEVKKVVDWLTKNYDDLLPDELPLESEDGKQKNSRWDDGGSETDDALYNEARGLVLEAGKASASYLQRRLKIGYTRAARLLDMLEANGVIGPGEGAKPRQVYGETSSSTDSSDTLPPIETNQ